MTLRKLSFVFLIVTAALLLSSWIRAELQDATYPGGKEAMEKFLKDSMRYPLKEQMLGWEAIVSVRFDVSKEGKVTNVQASFVTGQGSGFINEAVRLVASMPAWTPATDKKGKAVKDEWNTTHLRFELPDSLVHLPPPSEDTTLYTELDTVPVFPGEAFGAQRYLARMTHYPQMEKEQGKMGTVYIAYTIERNGKVSNVHAQKEVPDAPGLTREAIRVISSFPRHTPAIKNGKAVRYQLVMPVRFSLS
jgi:TonB family protein